MQSSLHCLAITITISTTYYTTSHTLYVLKLNAWPSQGNYFRNLELAAVEAYWYRTYVYYYFSNTKSKIVVVIYQHGPRT